MEKNEKRNKTITVIVIGVIVLLVVLVGATYAYFSSTSKTDPQTIKTAKVELLVEVDKEATHIENIKPTTWNASMETNNSNTDIVQIPIKVTNKSTVDINYDLFITPSGLALNDTGVDGDEQLLVGGDLSDVKYKLYEIKDGNVNTDTVIEDSLSNGDKRVKLISDKAIKALTENSTDNIQKYMLYIYIENKEAEQNKLQGITFDIKIEGATPSEKMAQTILANETPKEDKPDLTANSKDIGLYTLESESTISKMNTEKKEEEGKGKIYYYRGAVENNYVSFGTYKSEVQNEVYKNRVGKVQVVANEGDPILWRIVRINEDGSVTLITEHNIGDEETQKYVWNSNAIPYYVNPDGGGDSEIKQVIDKWYSDTIGSDSKLDKLVNDTNFCNDVTEGDMAVVSRLYKDNPEPTLDCEEKNQVTAKAGLISADEMVYAGALVMKAITNNTTYLDNGTYFWTMSAYQSDCLFNWGPFNWRIGAHAAKEAYAAARPVITISKDAIITKGDGTLENPFQLSMK